GYGPELSFVTPPSLPLVSTASLSNLMATSATAGGNVLNDGGAAVTARGIVWDTLAQPTLADFIVMVGDSLGIFSTPISGLIPGKIYYLRAYATNAAGTSYGEEISFVTPPVVPVVTTVAPTAITDSSATGGGTVTYNGGASISARGVVWGLSPNLTLDSMKTTDGTGTGAFVSNITGLSPVTTYYVRAYATNAAGTAYGEALSFTTLATVPTVTTDVHSALTDSSAVSGGNVVDDGGTPVTARGLVWGRGTGPTLDSLKTVNGSGNGTFTATIPNLDPETRYYVRAYATNARGTTYGNEVTFLTPAGLPRVTTLSISSLTDSSAVAAGNVLSDRGASVTARGIIWGTGANLTLDSTIVAGGSGTGLFSGNISGLSPNTKYYVRAYATNAVGTRYGNVVSFTTPISMVLVQGGTFTMGCTPEQVGDCDADENYPHDVTLSTFYLGRYEVTQAAWEAVMGSNPSSRVACPTCPVETVSWDDVQEYITRLNIETGFDYRLPTEAEWEYAARGGIASNGYKYAGGDGVDSIAWYLTNASGQTQEVGQKTPNELDLYDMSGNVWEWVSDRYEGIYDSVAVTNPTGPASGTQRVVRGGSWFALEADLRVSERSAFGPTDSQPIIGFRLARSVTPPLVETYAVGSITDSTAVGGGNVLSDGGSLVTERGVVWSTSSMPTLADDFTDDGTGAGLFTSNLNNLDPGTTYYVRAYATNGAGTSYGSEITFSTPPVLPEVTTSTVNVISYSEVGVGGNVVYNGGATVTARGVVWSANPSPTLTDGKVMSGSGTGMYTDTISGLDPVTSYYARAFATNIVGTAYGADITFTTPAGLPEVVTAATSGLTDNSAISGGEVLSDRGDSVTVRGVVWSLTPNPTTADNVITSGSDTGSYVSNLSGLTPATTYYVRAYATNGVGTAYGNEVSFNTAAALPTLGTTAASMITDSSAVSGGTILDDGGSAVIARGVVWDTISGPTLADAKTTDGTGTGGFVS
ncbi:MAG: SUMF1/EgtB/PvdO family nonheme iron enzyme, partial [Saprospiraceae bacterium]|nr:SUMF1/EgtB/PvdO family nonheme iron enzyme [Saprospiraceae bacterium]